MTLEREGCFHNQQYDLFRRLLNILGLWPSPKRSRRLLWATFITILLLVSINGQICLVAMLVLETKTELITEVLQTVLPSFLFSSAYWYLLYNSAQMKEILERFKDDWSELNSKEELKIMGTYAAQSKVAAHSIACKNSTENFSTIEHTLYYFIIKKSSFALQKLIAVYICVLTVTGGFLLYTIWLILPSILSFFLYISGSIDVTKVTLPVYHEKFVVNKVLYYAAISYELIVISVAYVIGITYYALLVSLLQHACALFIIVTNKIDQPFKQTENESGWSETIIKHETEFEWIIAVVKKYNNAINFVELIKSFYGQMYMVELSLFFCYIIMDFIYVFQLLNFMITVREAFKLCLYINGSLIMIYAYFFLGERLIQHSTSVYATCQLVPFYKLSTQTNKIFLLLMMRSMKPCDLSIRGTVVASHELFAKIIKTSFSFATVCYNVH